MTFEPTSILMVEDNHDYAWMLRLVLNEIDQSAYRLTNAATLEDAILMIRDENQVIDVILLDISLPDSQGYETFRRLQSFATEIPIIVLASSDDHRIGLKAVREGAQDFIVKGEIDVAHILRSIDYAIERHRNILELKRLSFLDELTGLLNRRGFLNMAEHHLKIADRTNREMLLFFADMDGLKQINDTFGHHYGDHALRAIASILETTFRSSDLIARLGGDEFTILAINAPTQNAEQIIDRLQNNINLYNANSQTYQLSLSVGVARFHPNEEIDLDKMLAKADRELYQHKRIKSQSPQNKLT
ncbi:MAG TPA: diguanylate cyclase response regulator [Anaerolineales bacterium]|nr:diguanylate cyclase response regulator [Anaerolineales bacterium]